MTARNCTVPISKVDRLLSDSLCASLWCSVSTYSDRRGSKRVGVRTGILYTRPSGLNAPAPSSDVCERLVPPQAVAVHIISVLFENRPAFKEIDMN